MKVEDQYCLLSQFFSTVSTKLRTCAMEACELMYWVFVSNLLYYFTECM